MKELNKLMTGIFYVGQLGLDLIMPVILCMLLAWFLDSKFGFGLFVFLPALVIGIAAGVTNFKKFYHKMVMKDVKKRNPKETEIPRFSNHT